MMIRDKGHDPAARLGAPGTYLCLGTAWADVSNSPFRYYKMWVHEGGISSPAIFHWPAQIKEKGALRHAPAHFIDVAATILGVAGLDATPTGAPPTSARNLAPVFDKDHSVPLDYLFFFHNGRALREGDYKVVSPTPNRSDDWCLYDLSNDRTEQNDLSKKFPEIKSRLIARWTALNDTFAKQYADGLPPGTKISKSNENND